MTSAHGAIDAWPKRPELIGRSPAIARVHERMAAVADSDAPLLLTGERGTGKDLVARIIHGAGRRADQPLRSIDCGALPRDGRFRAAAGTLFLDGIHQLSIAAQGRLLRVLQDAVGVRLITASHRPLEPQVAEGKFREDLYYRIGVLDIELPPLRERTEDLPLLVEHFLAKHRRPDRGAPTLSPQAWAALAQHHFPGNVRELEHAIHHALELSRGDELGLEHLPRDLALVGDKPVVPGTGEIRSLAEAVRDFERGYVQRALQLSHGNKTRAARLLGISRKNLWHKLSKMPSDPIEAVPS